jgi:hypothetical protein
LFDTQVAYQAVVLQHGAASGATNVFLRIGNKTTEISVGYSHNQSCDWDITASSQMSSIFHIQLNRNMTISEWLGIDFPASSPTHTLTVRAYCAVQALISSGTCVLDIPANLPVFGVSLSQNAITILLFSLCFVSALPAYVLVYLLRQCFSTAFIEKKKNKTVTH